MPPGHGRWAPGVGTGLVILLCPGSRSIEQEPEHQSLGLLWPLGWLDGND